MMHWGWAHRNRIAALTGLGGVWVLDVANAVPGLGNGFWDLSSEKGFHVGLWSAIAAFVFVALTDRTP